VDEIVVYNESNHLMQSDPMKDPNVFLARILLYQDCPQYLRKDLFPMQVSLKYAGLLNPLDAPHHVRAEERSQYREGLVIKQKYPKGQPENITGCVVNCGLRGKDVYVTNATPPKGARVTVEMQFENVPEFGLPLGKVVARRIPREKTGIYWGYTVRLAEGLQKVFDECPFEGGYDYKLGTSERGKSITSITDSMTDNLLPSFKHLLIVFGGVKGIEAAVDSDETMKVSSDEIERLFDQWINICPSQGSRTIRTEEAVLLSLSVLKSHIEAKGVRQ
jgi:predicted SPOUT superfamily RNA methylase MTH1